jgi:MFS family permease
VRSEIRTRYLRTLGLDASGATAKPRLEAALTRAYTLRNFEIEHYWKRGTYFWAFQVAIFAALGLILGKAEGGDWHLISFALAALGILTAFAHALSARASRFWQNNWEKHIDMLEDEIEDRLYKTVWLTRDSSVSFSVSRVNQYLSYYFAVFWGIIAVYVAWRAIVNCTFAWIYVPIIAVMTVLGVVWLFGQTTELEGTLPNDDGSHGIPISRDRHMPDWRWPRLRKHIHGAESHPFIRRHAPDEP